MDYKYIFKIVIVGDSNVGKTSLCDRYVYDSLTLSRPSPTIGIEYFSNIVNINDTLVKLNIWDTAGQEKFRSICLSYYRYSTGALVCFALNNSKSFENISEYIKELKIYGCKYTHIALVGTFADCTNDREVDQEDIDDLCKRYNINYYETSPKYGTNVDDTFTKFCENILLNVEDGIIPAKGKKETYVEYVNIDKSNSCCVLL